MLEEYIYHGKNRLRCGYTTGSCAAAAAKASAEMLLTGEILSGVSLITPKGIRLELEILNAEICAGKKGYAACAVKKDSGDGVGMVTKAGLDQPVGAAAINSVPQKMISGAVSEICEKYDYYGGIKITVFVPEGAEIAKKPTILEWALRAVFL